MSKRAKLLLAIRNNPKDVRFSDLVRLVLAVGFALVRQKGSHTIYQHPSFPMTPLNLQEATDGNAKPYQVDQVLTAIDKHNLEVD